VRAIGSAEGAEMVAAIIHLARALGLAVLAQGVDTGEQLAVLASLGCDQFQGELFSKPLPAAAMLGMLQKAGPDGPSIPPPTPRKRGSSR